jgi:hypothetical protein
MFNRIPDEMALTIFGFLPIRQKLHLQTTSKNWSRLLKNDMLWRQAGANSYEEFVNSMKLLSEELKILVLEDVYSLPFARDINRLCHLNVVQRQSELLSDDDINLMPQHERIDYLHALLSVPYGIMALKEKLITPAQIANMRCCGYIRELLSKNGLIALRRELITPEIANGIRSPTHCHYVFKEYGLIALSENLISIEQINKFSQARCLKILFSQQGLKALKESIIAPDEASKTRRASILKALLEENGILALKLKLISVEKADSFFSHNELENHITHLIEPLKSNSSTLESTNNMRNI